MCIIDHEYLKKIADKYNLFILLNHVKTRVHRMSMKRITPILCFHDKEIDKNNTYMYGHYSHSNIQGYNYYTYIEDLNKNLIGPNPIKLNFGRFCYFFYKGVMIKDII